MNLASALSRGPQRELIVETFDDPLPDYGLGIGPQGAAGEQAALMSAFQTRGCDFGQAAATRYIT